MGTQRSKQRGHVLLVVGKVRCATRRVGASAHVVDGADAGFAVHVTDPRALLFGERVREMTTWVIKYTHNMTVAHLTNRICAGIMIKHLRRNETGRHGFCVDFLCWACLCFFFVCIMQIFFFMCDSVGGEKKKWKHLQCKTFVFFFLSQVSS